MVQFPANPFPIQDRPDAQEGISTVLRHVEISYLQPEEFFNRIPVHCRAGRVRLNNSSLVFAFRFEDEDTLAGPFEDETVPGLAFFERFIRLRKFLGPSLDPLRKVGIFLPEILVKAEFVERDLDLGPEGTLFVGLNDVPVRPGLLCLLNSPGSAYAVR
jgi:hypothetical protein